MRRKYEKRDKREREMWRVRLGILHIIGMSIIEWIDGSQITVLFLFLISTLQLRLDKFNHI